jgi:hypothetical protein
MQDENGIPLISIGWSPRTADTAGIVPDANLRDLP